MSDIRNCAIIIESVQGVTPGLASGITYTCTLAFDDGERREGITGIRPTWRRWPAPIQIDAAVPRGTVNPDGSIEEGIYPGYIRCPDHGNEILSAFILELPHCEPCK